MHSRKNSIKLFCMCALCGLYPFPVSVSDFTDFFKKKKKKKTSQLNKIVLKPVEENAKTKLWWMKPSYCSMSATLVSPTVLEVVSHMWALVKMIATSSCSTYVTGVWLQQQPEDSMVFIHRQSEIGWDKTFNLFVRTDCTSVKFSPDVIERQGGIGAAVTCTSDVLIGIWFCFPMNVGLTLAMLNDVREFIAIG